MRHPPLHVDLDAGVLTIASSVTELGRAEKDTKTHQQRRISLDTETVEILGTHLAAMDEAAAQLQVKPRVDAFLFSYTPDGTKPMHPSGVTHRYARLNINTTLHKLRHYNATELVAAGVDLRTIAGRPGAALMAVTLPIADLSTPSWRADAYSSGLGALGTTTA